MKTPEEIKKGLGCCFADNQHDCKNCAYAEMVKDEEFGETFFYHCGEIDKDALAYIQQLETELDDEKNKNEILIFDNDKLMEEIAQVERERDAAVADFTQYVNYGEHECNLCRHKEEVCLDCKWEWRGLK
ncbi:MAG: hypothetical protein IKZ00_06320 [Bacteroidaceae bacterium]|nr:hypothetical protein [Bacteroidaceae bacterium]